MIRRARRDGKETGRNEEREKREEAIVSSSPQGMTSWSSSIKIWFFQAYRKKCHGMKQNAKICAIREQNAIIEVFILEELIRRERRDGGEGEERGLRKGEKESIEIERKETKGN